MKDSATVYRNQVDGLKALPAEQFKSAVLGLWEYELDGVMPDDPIAYALLMMVMPLVNKRVASAENGKKGGRPPKTKQKPTDNLTETKPEPTENQSETHPYPNSKEERINNNKYPYQDIVGYLNQKAGTNFLPSSKETRKHIKARIDEGFKLGDFKVVIDGRVAAWGKDPRMRKYLRPQTLFGTKFESYLNAKPSVSGNRFNNFVGRQYDYADLEHRLLQAQGSIE